MTSQAQALRPLAGVRGIIFLGFPLHPPDKPSITRTEHLSDVNIPMLFIQGTRDKLSTTKLLRAITKKLSRVATVHMIAQADHAFHITVRSGRTDAEVMSDLMDAFTGWIDRILAK